MYYVVCMQGVSEINTLYDKLAASFQFSGQSSDWILPLHSSVAAVDQKKVFQRPPENIRKVLNTIPTPQSILVQFDIFLVSGDMIEIWR